MVTSIFTPTHRADFIADTHQSVRSQIVQADEWLIVPNGDVVIPDFIKDDPKIRVVPAPPDIAGNIGALKRFACEQAKGDILVELDHDDILDPLAIGLVNQCIGEGAGFVYSDFINFLPDGKSSTYGTEFGWTTREKGKEIITEAFECDARSLFEIFYAPNHVRAWTRDTYETAGGHDRNMIVCDDHDLVCRTYLTGKEMRRIPFALYKYRLIQDGSNSFLRHNALIQTEQLKVGNKYFYQMVDEWARRRDLPKFDFGGRFNAPFGYKTIDLQNADIIHDLTTPLPFSDSSVGVIRAYDFLEHIPPQHVVSLMNEIYRVLVPGGWLLSSTPSTDGRGAFQDPTHVSFWNQNSFWYYTNRKLSQYVPAIKCRFQSTRLWTEFPTEWHKQHNIPYVFADLCAIKGQRIAGLQTI